MTTVLRPRIAELHRSIIENVPCDGKASWREGLRATPFPRAMCVYLNWVARMIPPRPRKVRCSAGFWNGDVSMRRRDAVAKLIERIETGQDLEPHYSGRVEHKGFALDRYDADGRLLNHKWRDKDFALNALGVHHLHFGDDAAGGHRSDDLLFVAFGRDEAVCIMVGGHRHLEDEGLPELETRVLESSFGIPPGQGAIEMPGWTPSERMQLARAGFSMSAVVNGQVVMSMPISNAGMTTRTMHHASRILRAIARLDEQIDAPQWVANIFEQYGDTPPLAADFEWVLSYGNFLLRERSMNTNFCIIEDRLGLPTGPNTVLLTPKAA